MYKFNPFSGKLDKVGDSQSLIVGKTYAELSAIITAGTLVSGTIYTITDRGDNGLSFEAVANNKLSPSGIRNMFCPAYYGTGINGGNNWIGIWNDQLLPAINDLAIWGGLVWKNLTGAVGNSTADNELDAVNWELVPKDTFENGEYVELVFRIDYDFVNDWINKQYDDKNNVIGIDYESNQNDAGYIYNPVDLTDWNISSKGNMSFQNNVAAGIFNNPFVSYLESNKVSYLISNNTNQESISHNIGYGYSEISGNSNNGYIESNIFSELIGRNSNDGNIVFNRNLGYITNNSNLGEIANCSGVLSVSDYDNTTNDITVKEYDSAIGDIQAAIDLLNGEVV